MAEGAHREPHTDSSASQLNWLRAAVLGANDGIVSLAALLVGVAGATSDSGHIFLTGIAGLLAGALSMAIGEYVSVSSQRDIEEQMGSERLSDPWRAAFASAASFFAGAIIPLVAILLPPAAWRIPITFAAVFVALVITGILSARVSEVNTLKVVLRNVIGGGIAMAITYGIGLLFGTSGIA